MSPKKNNITGRIKAMNTLTKGFKYDVKNEVIRKYLERVIVTAHDRLNNQIQDEDIDFDIYEIVTSMISTEKPYLIDYLTQIDPSQLNDQHLVSFNNIISTVVSDLDDTGGV